MLITERDYNAEKQNKRNTATGAVQSECSREVRVWPGPLRPAA